MEHQLWKAIVALLPDEGKKPAPTRYDFSDEEIVKVHYWSLLWDRPTLWACQRKNWPLHLRKRRLPSPATMSRRLRSPSVIALLDALERRVVAPQQPRLFWMIDGKSLAIGGCSKDRQAGYGKAAGGKAKGYKLHTLVSDDGFVAQWRVAPMNKDERVVAQRLLKAAPPQVHGYVVADANYDSNKLHQICDERGNLQLVTPRRYGPGKSTGHRQQTAGRLRSIALTESPYPAFARRLLQDRSTIERQYGNLTNWGGGLTSLPAWVRTHRRVRRWVQAKMVLARLKRHADIRTCAA
jgi:Transposase DDE domain